MESTQARMMPEWQEHMLGLLCGCGAQHCHQMATVLTERKPYHSDRGPTSSSIQMNLKKRTSECDMTLAIQVIIRRHSANDY